MQRYRVYAARRGNSNGSCWKLAAGWGRLRLLRSLRNLHAFPYINMRERFREALPGCPSLSHFNRLSNFFLAFVFATSIILYFEVGTRYSHFLQKSQLMSLLPFLHMFKYLLSYNFRLLIRILRILGSTTGIGDLKFNELFSAVRIQSV
jgi:hypothetical protein